MITFGYVVDTKDSETGVLMIQTRIPSVHGGRDKSNYRGRTQRNYVRDADLPWYPSIEISGKFHKDDVVVLSSMNANSSSFIVIGKTGGMYVPDGDDS